MKIISLPGRWGSGMPSSAADGTTKEGDCPDALNGGRQGFGLNGFGGLPPMLHSSANAASEKCLPSFSSIKGAHTDPALMLARARSTGSNATPAPMGSGHADPSALLARARGEAGMGGLPRNNALSGISLLPFQSVMLRFEQPRAASERAGGAGSESAGQRGALASECHSSVGGGPPSLIDQHKQMRIQQQQRQPQGLNLPLAGTTPAPAVRNSGHSANTAQAPPSTVCYSPAQPAGTTKDFNKEGVSGEEGVIDVQMGQDGSDASDRMLSPCAIVSSLPHVDHGGLPPHGSQSFETVRDEILAACEGGWVPSSNTFNTSYQWLPHAQGKPVRGRDESGVQASPLAEFNRNQTAAESALTLGQVRQELTVVSDRGRAKRSTTNAPRSRSPSTLDRAVKGAAAKGAAASELGTYGPPHTLLFTAMSGAMGCRVGELDGRVPEGAHEYARVPGGAQSSHVPGAAYEVGAANDTNDSHDQVKVDARQAVSDVSRHKVSPGSQAHLQFPLWPAAHMMMGSQTSAWMVGAPVPGVGAPVPDPPREHEVTKKVGAVRPPQQEELNKPQHALDALACQGTLGCMPLTQHALDTQPASAPGASVAWLEQESAKRLGQLQHFIGSARAKQDKWKERVDGGQMFKKNQERSFIEALQTWHSQHVIHLYVSSSQGSEVGESVVRQGGCAHGSARGNVGVQVPLHLRLPAALSHRPSLYREQQQQPSPKRRAIQGENGEIMAVMEDELKAPSMCSGSKSSSEACKTTQASNITMHTSPDLAMTTTPNGDDASACVVGGCGGSEERVEAGDRVEAGAVLASCPIACNNIEAHDPSRITGWSVLCMEMWNKEKKMWFTCGNEAAYKPGSFNMCLRHMGFRPTKPARYGVSGYDWETSTGFVFDSQMRAKYVSKRSHNSTRPATAKET